MKVDEEITALQERIEKLQKTKAALQSFAKAEDTTTIGEVRKLLADVFPMSNFILFSDGSFSIRTVDQSKGILLTTGNTQASKVVAEREQHAKG